MNKKLQCTIIRRWDYPDELTFSILNDIIPSSATVSHHSYTGAKCVSGDTFAVESDVEEAAVEEIETVVAVHGAGTVERLLGEGVAVVVNNVQLLEVVNNRRLLQVSHRALHAAWGQSLVRWCSPELMSCAQAK